MFEHKEVIRYGFIYFGVTFIWRNKELYKLPYFDRNTKRAYNEKKLKPTKRNTTIGYKILGDFKSMKNLKEITTKIKVSEIINNNLPF